VKLLAIIFARICKLKLRCSNPNIIVLWIRIINNENMTNDLLPILFNVISSLSSNMLYGIVIFDIVVLIKAIKTVAVE